MQLVIRDRRFGNTKETLSTPKVHTAPTIITNVKSMADLLMQELRLYRDYIDFPAQSVAWHTWCAKTPKTFFFDKNIRTEGYTRCHEDRKTLLLGWLELSACLFGWEHNFNKLFMKMCASIWEETLTKMDTQCALSPRRLPLKRKTFLKYQHSRNTKPPAQDRDFWRIQRKALSHKILLILNAVLCSLHSWR